MGLTGLDSEEESLQVRNDKSLTKDLAESAMAYAGIKETSVSSTELAFA
jgi:hypothetical protein